jgi:hypothetical protein
MFRELSSIGRTIALYIQGAEVQTSIISLIYLKSEISNHQTT